MARKIQEINAGSMADIAFLLLIFFLVTTTMDTDAGLGRMLPPMPQEDQQDPPPINERNVFIVLVNSQDKLFVEGEPLDISQLRSKAKEFIDNPMNRQDLPVRSMKYIEYLQREVEVCDKDVISVRNDNSTTYATYIAVQNELVAAYNELRDQFSQNEWGKLYDDLDADQQKAVRQVYFLAISEAEPKITN